MSHDDFAFEPIEGLPEHLPAGEDMIWQGSPKLGALARRAFHTRTVMIYFAALMVWRVGEVVTSGGTWASGLLDAVALLPLAAAALIVLYMMAWAYASSTIYTITNKRVVLRYGVALPMTVNLPFTVIDGASVRTHSDGTGDIPLVLSGSDRIAYLHLWPNARPWHVAKPQPMLRSIPNPGAVTKILTDALRADALTNPQASDDATPKIVPQPAKSVNDGAFMPSANPIPAE